MKVPVHFIVRFLRGTKDSYYSDDQKKNPKKPGIYVLFSMQKSDHPKYFKYFLQQSMCVCHLTELHRFIFKQC